MSNTETVNQIYAAFGRGDIPAILNQLTEDVLWEYCLQVPDVPWLQPRKGRTEVPKFFESLGIVEFHKFIPKMLFENGDVVIALIDVEFTVRSANRRVTEEDEVHIWHFNKNGKVRKFGHKVDSYQHWAAFKDK